MIWASIGAQAARRAANGRCPQLSPNHSTKKAPRREPFHIRGNGKTRQTAYFSAAARFASILVSTSTATTMSTSPRPREIHGVLVIPAMM